MVRRLPLTNTGKKGTNFRDGTPVVQDMQDMQQTEPRPQTVINASDGTEGRLPVGVHVI